MITYTASGKIKKIISVSYNENTVTFTYGDMTEDELKAHKKAEALDRFWGYFTLACKYFLAHFITIVVFFIFCFVIYGFVVS